jgi:uncharacterized membrane protein
LLFAERYVINTVRYHTPVPDCSKILTVKQCSAYGPWIRDYYLNTHKDGSESKNPFEFSGDWFYGMWLRTFFSVDGPATDFQTRGPLVLPAISAIVLAVGAVLASVWAWRRLLKRYEAPVLWLFLVVSGVYIVILWLDEYRAFLRTGQSVAINGRYLLPVDLLLFVIGALALNQLLRRWPVAKTTLFGLALICFIWGGGGLTYKLRSSDSWYWPNSPLKGANHAIQRDVGPLVPGYRNSTEFMSRN